MTESAGLATASGYEPENMEVVPIEQAPMTPGERVTIVEDHEIYPDEGGVIMAVGKHSAYGGTFLFDVLIDGTDEPWRFMQHELAELA
jgi:hypothetical protein